MTKHKYMVTGEITISVHIDVEADSEEAARNIAKKSGNMSLCGACSYGEEGAWSTSGELDGEVSITGIERV